MRQLVINYLVEVYNGTDEECRDEFWWTPESLRDLSDQELLDAYTELVSFQG